MRRQQGRADSCPISMYHTEAQVKYRVNNSIGHFTAELRSMQCIYFALQEIITHLVHTYVQMSTCHVVAAMPQINLPSPHQ
jgi:hypothetical protein